jgi:hypothetical protein
MVIPPGSSHSFWILVVWHDVVVIGEIFVADRTFLVLLDSFPIQEFSHFCWRPEFRIPPRVMWVFNALDPEAQNAHLSDLVSATAQDGSVDWAVFITAEFHRIAPGGFSEMKGG